MKTASNSRVLRAVFLIVLVWILHGGVPICTQAAIVYEVIDLGTLGGPGSAALSINDPGQIIGEADERATLFDQTGAGNNIKLYLTPRGQAATSTWAHSEAMIVSPGQSTKPARS
jgi:hypothetical protein